MNLNYFTKCSTFVCFYVYTRMCMVLLNSTLITYIRAHKINKFLNKMKNNFFKFCLKFFGDKIMDLGIFGDKKKLIGQ